MKRIIILLALLSCAKQAPAGDGGGNEPVAPEAQPVTISLDFHDNDKSSFVWPFQSPSVEEISNTMTKGSFQGVRKDLVHSFGGYVFTVYSTKGCAQHPSGGFIFGGQDGSYLEFPSFPGLCLNSVELTAGTTSTAVMISAVDGKDVDGGGAVSGFIAIGETLLWTLCDTEPATKYRLSSAGNANVAVRRLVLKYGPKPNRPEDKENVSPLDYGLKSARTGEQRYWALFKAHRDAKAKGVDVDYTDVGDIQLTIPSDASSLPLGRHTDFKGATFTVLNNQKHLALFKMVDTVNPVSVSGDAIDRADYSSVPELATGTHLLFVQDDNLWVENRKGYDYGATRRDLFIVKDGVGSCEPCASYSTPSTIINARYREVDEEQKLFCNLNFVRDPGSTFRTYIVSFSYQNNIYIHHVNLTTTNVDENSEGDSAIAFTGCTNILAEDLNIDGTYSWTDRYGYGISCNGVWNSTFRRIRSNTKWGVFGNNNTHDSFIEDCDVNRFDTHCYGKNISFRNCRISGQGMPCSSIFGTISIEDSTFSDCYLFTMRPDYNAYVPFDIVIRNCVYNPSGSALFSMGNIDDVINSRPELADKHWPNVSIDGLTVNIRAASTFFCMFWPATRDSYAKKLGTVSRISMKNVGIVYPAGKSTVPFYLSRYEVGIRNSLQLSLEKVKIQAGGDAGPADFHLNLTGPGEPDVRIMDSNLNVIK